MVATFIAAEFGLPITKLMSTRSGERTIPIRHWHQHEIEQLRDLGFLPSIDSFIRISSKKEKILLTRRGSYDTYTYRFSINTESKIVERKFNSLKNLLDAL